MNIKQKTTLIIVIIIAVISLLIVNAWNSARGESDGVKTYAVALEYYKAEDYHKAYKAFGNVPSKSTLKSAAIYRQAKCAEFMQSPKLTQKHYRQLIRRFPDFTLSVRIKYLLAQNIYEQHPKRAKRKFQSIIKKYPKSEYAIASKYYLGLIQLRELEGVTNQTKLALDLQKAEDYFKDYLKDAPAGRYAIYSINKIKDLNRTTLTSEDNLIIARSYYALGEFDLAKKHLDSTNVAYSWCDIVKNYYELRNYAKVREYTEKGMARYSQYVDKKDMYKAIDLYLQSSSGNKNNALMYLSDLSKGKEGEDYIRYITCRNSAIELKDQCYAQLYQDFPKGQFAADALANVFYSNVKFGNYKSALKLGKEHLNKFPKSNSTPLVLFWLGKTEERAKNYEDSRVYYKRVMKDYPDTYYAYRAYVDMYRIENPLIVKDLTFKPVVFPYEKSKDGNMVVKLALLKDYGMVNELCKNDKFVQSWLAYEDGKYNTSVVLARDAMEEMTVKPPKTDFRWRLVYPIHYYDYAKEFALDNNPVLLLSIIKEESHFDPKATSGVGAKGLMQLMPQTASEVKNAYGIASSDQNYLYNPKINVQLGSLYFSKLKKINDGSEFYAVLSYNGGLGMVKSWRDKLTYQDRDDFLEQVPYPETQDYLKKVYRAYWNYARIYGSENE